MSGPFKQLFHELTAEAFAIAKGLGEAAVVEAHPRTKPAATEPRNRWQPIRAFNEEPANRYILERYGWRSFAITSSPFAERLEFNVVRTCGHRLKLRTLGEIAFAAAPAFRVVDTLLAALDRRVEERPRDCYCVPERE